jgi:hypothetical protein
MIEGRFDARTLASMNVALERVCQQRPDGEDHKVQQARCSADHPVRKGGKRTLGALTKAGERA